MTGRSCLYDESFDVILMFDVIEHIPAVDRYLKNEVYRVLKKGGLLLFKRRTNISTFPGRYGLGARSPDGKETIVHCKRDVR